MSVSCKKTHYDIIDRACFSLLELTRCSHLLLEKESLVDLKCATKERVETLNVKLWRAKFSFFLTQYALKKELKTLIILLLNIDLSFFRLCVAVLFSPFLHLLPLKEFLTSKQINAP